MQELISRKDFMRSFFSYIRERMDMVPSNTQNNFSGCILPPGALPLSDFTTTCTKCYQCVSVCPHEAIRVYREDSDKLIYGYPVIDPRHQGCLLCEDYPCISVCEAGALVKNNERPRLGTAIINSQTCLAYHNHFCQTCISNCPETGKAIRLNNECRPEVVAAYCTGCGICVQSCPADPPAILIQSGII